MAFAQLYRETSGQVLICAEECGCEPGETITDGCGVWGVFHTYEELMEYLEK